MISDLMSCLNIKYTFFFSSNVPCWKIVFVVSLINRQRMLVPRPKLKASKPIFEGFSHPRVELYLAKFKPKTYDCNSSLAMNVSLGGIINVAKFDRQKLDERADSWFSSH